MKVDKRNSALLVIMFLGLVACATLKTAARTLNDIAKDLCLLTASEQVDKDGASLDGLTPAQWCDIKKNLDPFIEEALRAKQSAAGLSGLAAPQ